MRFVAACYYEPEAAFAEERLFEHMAAAGALVDDELGKLARRLSDAFAAADLQALRIDYTRLFLGPVQAPALPYASVWLSGKSEVMQPEALEVLKLYDDAGFAIDDEFHELPDHIAVELEFLYRVLHAAVAARAAGDDPAVELADARRRAFVDGHLAAWTGPFLRAQREAAETPFYATLAELTGRLLEIEARRLPAGPAR